MIPRLRTRILGAGVAGLAAAGALARDGHEVELIDEAFALPPGGTALVLFGSGREALDRLGVLEEIRDHCAAPREGRLMNADGRVLARIPAGDTLLVPRTDLVRILRDSLPATVVRRTGRFEDPAALRRLQEDTHVLVGADGVHSPLRRTLWPGDRSARSHAVTVLRGTADIAPPEIAEIWGPGWLFGITPLPGGRMNWFASCPEHRTGSTDEDLAHLRALIGGRLAPIDAVLEAATAETTLVHGILTAPPVIPVRGRTVLIGDAAHAMAPNLGHGANTALEDAMALARVLRRPGSRAGADVGAEQDPTSADAEVALRRYRRRRTVPGQAWRIGSSAMMRLASARRTAPARDAVLGTLGAVTRR